MAEGALPAEFMAAVMTADMDNTEKVVGLVDECWRMGLKILPPDINSGLYHFHVNDDGEIVYGIGAIKAWVKGQLKLLLRRATKAVTSASCLISVRARTSKTQPPGAGKVNHVRGV